MFKNTRKIDIEIWQIYDSCLLILDDFILPGNQMYMNEFSSIYQASEDLMDHCVLAETDGNYQDAIRHCSQAIGTTY